MSLSEAAVAMSEADKAVIIVVNNGPFEAAGFAYNQGEFEAFTQADDHRPRQFVVMDRAKAKELTGYKGA